MMNQDLSRGEANPVRLKWIHTFTDRHGKVRHYFRHRGYRAVLPGPPGSDQFLEAYRCALGAHSTSSVAARESLHITPGTMNDLIVRYYKSVQWHGLSASSQKSY